MFFKASIEVAGHANIQASILVCKDVCIVSSSLSQCSGFSRERLAIARKVVFPVSCLFTLAYEH